MSCRICRGPDSGTTDLCSACEARQEYEQNLDDEHETGRPVALGYHDRSEYDAYRDMQAEQPETPVARVVQTMNRRALEQAREVESREVADRARPSSSGRATAADPGPARTLAVHHEENEAA